MSEELDELAERISRRVLEEVDEYRHDPVAQAMLPPYVRLNLDQAMLALRGETTATTTARNVALADAIRDEYAAAKRRLGGS